MDTQSSYARPVVDTRALSSLPTQDHAGVGKILSMPMREDLSQCAAVITVGEDVRYDCVIRDEHDSSPNSPPNRRHSLACTIFIFRCCDRMLSFLRPNILAVRVDASLVAQILDAVSRET
jgi:hypothetical protein